MDATDFEKISGQLADIATKHAGIGDFLGSDAGRYLLGGGLGAGAGALIGAAQPDRAKKKRNMLYYGALGGLGGLGLAHVLGRHADNREQAEENRSAATAAAAAAEAARPGVPGAKLPTMTEAGTGAGLGLAAGVGANKYIAKPVERNLRAREMQLKKTYDTVDVPERARVDNQAAQALTDRHGRATAKFQDARSQVHADTQARRKVIDELYAKYKSKIPGAARARALDPSRLGKKLPEEFRKDFQKKLDAWHSKQLGRADAPLHQHDARTTRLTERQTAQMQRLRAGQSAAATAADEAFKARMLRSARGRGWAGRAATWLPALLSALGGTYAPGAVQQSISGE